MKKPVSSVQDPRLFIGLFPCGFVYSDRTREEFGDYKRLAFLPYNTLVLDVRPNCPPDLLREIQSHAKQYKPGQVIQVTSSGQTMTLGLKCLSVATATAS